MEHSDTKIDYIRSFLSSGLPIIEQIAADNAVRNDVQPQVEPETGRFLELLTRLTRAERVLELGTSNGYSALWILKALKETGGHLVTIDSKERLHEEAVENFRKAGFDNVTAVFGDAAAELDRLEPGFDMIFQDCGKYLYPELLDRTIGLLRPGGLLVADDTLFSFEDDVRPNLGRYTDQYNTEVYKKAGLLSSIIPIGHGLTLSFKL